MFYLSPKHWDLMELNTEIRFCSATYKNIDCEFCQILRYFWQILLQLPHLVAKWPNQRATPQKHALAISLFSTH